MSHDEIVAAFFRQQRQQNPKQYKETMERYPILSRFRLQEIAKREMSLEELQDHERKTE